MEMGQTGRGGHRRWSAELGAAAGGTAGGAAGGLDFEERRGRWRSAVRLPASLVGVARGF